jgi:hypothetical protein
MGASLGLGYRVLAIAGVVSAGALGAAVALAAGPHPAGDGLPPPRFGHTLDIGLVSGTVIVTLPSGRSFTLGTQDRNIPIGSLIDTTRGRVDLRAAPLPPAAPAGATASRVEDAQFYQGAFRVRQTAGNPVTQIHLAGGQFAECSAAGGTAGTIAARATLPHRVVRLLRASGLGRFETDGRYADATVRGTIWLTEDFCDGTLVQVSRGIVSVEDLVTHTTVTVTAPHSFFARAP